MPSWPELKALTIPQWDQPVGEWASGGVGLNGRAYALATKHVRAFSTPPPPSPRTWPLPMVEHLAHDFCHLAPAHVRRSLT